ncbi:MAG: hypothetical protein FWB96_01320 [Defluviitaleaceae bacterium]|nr:hypothetical protein [Defluviitaleaceae bacterium]MCL2261667.1 hypothetical protein [Defluviitaleaceae bacterium]
MKRKSYKTDAIRYLFWPEISDSMAIHVIRTKRKTIEVSSAPYLREGYIRCPRDTSREAAAGLVVKHAAFFKEGVLNHRYHTSKRTEAQ